MTSWKMLPPLAWATTFAFGAHFWSGCGSDDSASGAAGAGGSDASVGGGGASGGSGGSAGSGGSDAGVGGGGGAAGGAAGSGGSATSTTGTLVPLYTYPTDATWSLIVTTKQAHPNVPIVAVVNPNSGPGSSADASFVTGTKALSDAGIVVIGYVATGYGARDAETEVKPEIDRYIAWYPATTGIFFDEQSADAGDVGYYAALGAYVKSKGLTLTVGNPGTDTDPSYIGALDVMLIYESKGLPSDAELGGWHTSYDRKNFGIIPYAVSFDAVFVQHAKPYVGWVYLTDDDLPNPWDTLPPYFDDLVSELGK